MDGSTRTKAAKIGDIVAEKTVPTLEEEFYGRWVTAPSKAKKGIFDQLDILLHGFIRGACYIALKRPRVRRKSQYNELVQVFISRLQKFSVSMSCWERILNDLETIASCAREEALAQDE